MPSQRYYRYVAGCVLAVALGAGVSESAGAPAAGQQAAPKQRTSPIYATMKDGTPVTGLTAADLTVTVAGAPIEGFTLTKGGSQNKLVFLVFDTASLSSNLLAKSKKIAQATVGQAGETVRFVVLTIDPGAGLRPICGPTTDKEQVTKTIGKSVTAKSGSYHQNRTTDGSDILDALPGRRTERTNPIMANEEKDLDHTQDAQIATVIITSLRTLNIVLGRFPDSDKVVQFYSSGIPQSATQNRSKPMFPVTAGSGGGEDTPEELASSDRTTLDLIKTAGQDMKRNGALFFAVDLAGTRIGEDADSSGEQSLRMIVNESGGRFFKGADVDITKSLAKIEQGYYELSVPLLQEIQDAGLPLEVRAKNPDITLDSVSSLAKSRSFAEMTPNEKRYAIMAILSNGLVGDIGLKVSRVPVSISGNEGEALLSVQLPAQLSQAEWDIYKVWRDTTKGTFQMEKEHVLSESPILTFSMAAKENSFQDAVLIQAKSGTALVCESKEKPKS